MKRQYLLYLTLIPILYLIYSVHTSYSSASAFFYGFAENKETELSHESDVSVLDIHVTEGESVVAGQLLMTVYSLDLAEQEIDNEYEGESDLLDLLATKGELQEKKALLLNEQSTYVTERLAIRQEIKNKEQQNRDELAAITSVDVKVPSVSAKALAQIQEIDREIASYKEQVELRIKQIDSQLNTIGRSQKLVQKKMSAVDEQLTSAHEKLEIMAPANGVIGNIQTKKGEHVKKFTTLLTFYEENPTIVKGYVHENFILQVNTGDSLVISSTLRPEHVTRGEVVGLGSRIVEIPERLRKMPTVKTYGREVLVRIPSDNRFLQKEKVSINSDAVGTLVPKARKNSKLEKKLKKKLSVK